MSDALRMSVEEVRDLLKLKQQTHQLARLVDADDCREVVLDQEGPDFTFGKRCFSVWASELRCSNCSSYRAHHTASIVKKQERVGHRLYEIHSQPIHMVLSGGAVMPVTMEVIDSREATEDDMTIPAKVNENGEYLIRHDVLTGLLNARGFYEAVRKVLRENTKERYVLISINVRHFKLLQELHGAEKGNHVLLIFANRILKMESAPDTLVGRLWGDEFAIFKPYRLFSQDRLQRELERAEVSINGNTIHVQAHAGVYPITEPRIPVSVMVGHADMARRSIRESRANLVSFYSQKLLDSIIKKQEIISSFEELMAENAFRVYYQPQVNRDGKIVGAEALVRCFRADGTIIPPASFIPYLEGSGQIAKLDKFVWETAAAQLKKWSSRDGYKDLAISINVSPKDFYYLNCRQVLDNLVEKYQIDKKKLHVEITESAIIYDMERESHTLDDLRKAGYVLEIDDFGKGYSSLNTLKNVDVETLKIDMAFLQMTEENKEKGKVILKSILMMGQALGLKVLIEGVETEKQFQTLLNMGYDYFQGYLFSRPIPVSEFEAVLHENKYRIRGNA